MMKTNGTNAWVACSLTLLLSGCNPDSLTADEISCTTGQTYASVVTVLGFARTISAGVAPGFDLDGRVSDQSDYRSCGHVDFVDPDGVKGIDNQLAPLMPEVENQVGNALDGLVQGAINDGQLVILSEMENVDDLTNDSCVNFSVQVGVKKRLNLGTDGIIEGYQTFDPDPMAEHSHVARARIENGVLTTDPFPVAIPIKIFDVEFTIHVQDARFRFSIDEDGKLHGYLGGGLLPKEILDGVSPGAGVGQYVAAIKVAMEANTDLGYNDETGKCELFSSALEFAATPAFIRR